MIKHEQAISIWRFITGKKKKNSLTMENKMKKEGLG